MSDDRILIDEEKFLEWAKILRETDLPQGKGNLKTDKGYCCIGVLCEYHEIPSKSYTDDYGTLWEFDGKNGVAPFSLLSIMGKNLHNTFNDEVFEYKFQPASFNDYDLMSFPEIADEIEKYVRKKSMKGETY